MADCIFCKIVAGELPADIKYQDDELIVFNDIRPKAKIHLLIVPKEHIINLNSLDEGHQELISHMVLLLPKLAKEQGLDAGFRTVINTGRGGGQEVDHLHFHLMGGLNLPRF